MRDPVTLVNLQLVQMKELPNSPGKFFSMKKLVAVFMALGSGYPETGSVNQSAIHWDMICDLRDGGEIWADDTLLYKNGKFALTFHEDVTILLLLRK